MPKVSVIMSVYNEPVEWMKQAIDSILNQTFTDFEFIIINDNPGRMENRQLLAGYASTDSRLVIVTNEQNIGLTESLNIGLKRARGEYIARMDADDISLPDRFGAQVGYMASHDDIAVCGTSAYIIDEEGKRIGKKKVPCDQLTINSLLLFESPMIHPSVMFRRQVNNMPVVYDENFKYAQDYALWAVLFKNNTMTNLPDRLIEYRSSGSQISRKNIDGQNGCSKNVIAMVIHELGLPCSEDIRDLIFVMTKGIDVKITIPSVTRTALFLKDVKNSNLIDEKTFTHLFLTLAGIYIKRKYGLYTALCYCFSVAKSIGFLDIKLPVSVLKG